MINPKEAVLLLSFDANNKKRRRRAAFGAAALFVMGALFGAYILMEYPLGSDPPGNQSALEGPEAEQTPEAAVGAEAARETTIAGDAQVEWLARFTACEHELKLDPAGKVTGMTRKELEAAYPEYAIEMFDSKHARLVKSVEGCCSEHFMLKLGENSLIITKMDARTLKPKEVMRIIVDTGVLDEQARTALEGGIVFDSLATINAFLEGVGE